MHFLAKATEFGVEVGRLDRALGAFGIEASRAAAKGSIDTEDAEKIFAAFRDARSLTREGKRPALAPSPQQISKFRQFIKYGERFGDKGVSLLEWTCVQDFFFDKCEHSYEGLLKVCRFTSKYGRLPKANEIEALF